MKISENFNSQVNGTISAITKYGSAYEQLEQLQKDYDFLQKGDQKTGVIGEFFSYLYLKDKFPNGKITIPNASNKGVDLIVNSNKEEYNYQVKTVSAFSETKRLSPLKNGWTHLILIVLDKSFMPELFFIIEKNNFKPETKTISLVDSFLADYKDYDKTKELKKILKKYEQNKNNSAKKSKL